MNEYAVLTHRVTTGDKKRKRITPVFDVQRADGLKIVGGCLVLFVHTERGEETVKTYGVGGWLDVEEQEAD